MDLQFRCEFELLEQHEQRDLCLILDALAQVDSATSSDAGAENEEDEDEEDGKKKLSKRHSCFLMALKGDKTTFRKVVILASCFQ